MTFYTTQRLLLINATVFPCQNHYSSKRSTTYPTHLSPSPSPFSPAKFLTRTRGRVHSVHPRRNSYQNPFKNRFILESLVLFAFSVIFLCLRLLSNLLLPNFPHRWDHLVTFSEEAEARTSGYPLHLWQAVIAYEDRRFFSHFGIDPVGIARAVSSFSARGGGSTITQQLVKNTFLKNERTFSRKIVEIVLALALERTISKWRILSSYVSKIYWGHGIFGIESASIFYFGKHPSLLSLGESALLAGMIPAPELRSPLRDPSRGKTFQARVLKRMVEIGLLDFETALLVVKQSLHLCADGPECADGMFYSSSFSEKLLGRSIKLKREGVDSAVKKIWDWESESKIWEAREDMERWAIRVRNRTSARISGWHNKRKVSTDW
ncbi:hypothetical protein L1049_025859 [Liquidambar formosana]|uniref:Glycosyl transferase family 51 domain-containing protein n=1 Tax=Liquidambar formosana TaxID=63359 RepID=A0AAP0R4Y6_LIQFO